MILFIMPSTSMMVGMLTTPASQEIYLSITISIPSFLPIFANICGVLVLDLLTKDYNFGHRLTILTQSVSRVAL